jgi:hypothetical protein
MQLCKEHFNYFLFETSFYYKPKHADMTVQVVQWTSSNIMVSFFSSKFICPNTLGILRGTMPTLTNVTGIDMKIIFIIISN